ncbi:MAG: hypothetical protein AAB217_23210, partial [Chloroflexota bacterium]
MSADSFIKAFVAALILGLASIMSVDCRAASTLYPNLPAGLNALYQYDGNGLPNNGAQNMGPVNMALGVGSTNNVAWGHSLTVNDPSAPIDGPMIYDFLYTVGQGGGTSGGGINLWNAADYPQVTEYYEAMWFRLPGQNFEGPGTAGQWKMPGYWSVGAPPGGYAGQIYGVIQAAGATTPTSAGVLASQWSMSIRAQVHVSWAVYGAGLNVLCGKWYRMETRMVLENPVGATNGILEVGLTNVTDGAAPVKIISSADRTYRNAANPAGFWSRHFVPVWGGGSLGPKTRDDHLQIARMAAWAKGGTITLPPTDIQAPAVPANLSAQAASSSQINLTWNASTDNV